MPYLIKGWLVVNIFSSRIVFIILFIATLLYSNSIDILNTNRSNINEPLDKPIKKVIILKEKKSKVSNRLKPVPKIYEDKENKLQLEESELGFDLVSLIKKKRKVIKNHIPTKEQIQKIRQKRLARRKKIQELAKKRKKMIKNGVGLPDKESLIDVTNTTDLAQATALNPLDILKAKQIKENKKSKHIYVGEEYPQEKTKVNISIIDVVGKKSKGIKGIAKLAIIIDDVTHKRQLKKILSLPIKVTPSIFPPSEMSSHSNRLAIGLKHFMIHLPLQSGSKRMNRMKNTLFVYNSDTKFKQRAKEIRRLFPNGKFINNHTGSVFTSNYEAMNKLYSYLKDEGFQFIDSRTAANSKIRRIAKEHNDPYISRDIFLDNIQNVSYIKNQLKKAVAIAKKRGYAIAIGHPHRATLKALQDSKDILRGVETIYIDEYPLLKR